MAEKFEIARFRDAESAADLCKAVGDAGIACMVSSTAPAYDISAVGRGTITGEYLVIVEGEQDEARARTAMLEGDRLSVSAGVPEDYYLTEFSTSDLQSVVERPREWSSYNVAVAEHLLTQRGEPFQQAVYAVLTSDSPERTDKARILAQGTWVLVVFICVLLWKCARTVWSSY
jgi:hypothetical protein